MARSLYLVSYDISDNRTRTRVGHLLEGYGERVQLSVFEVWLNDGELGKLRGRLTKAVEREGSVRIYALCAACRGRVEILGSGELSAEVGLLII